MSNKDLTRSNSQQIAAFVKRAKSLQKQSGSKGRLLFAMDATASRQPSWDRASHLQVEMFNATADQALEVQLAYYRGFEEFAVTPWLNNSKLVQQKMSRVSCVGGYSQINKILNHALKENKKTNINALVFIGDAVEEDSKHLYHLAGQLGLFKIPAFMFQEGHEPQVREIFQHISQLSGGAYSHFDHNSPRVLAELLAAVACYSTGGKKALEKYIEGKSSSVKRLTQQLSS